MSARRETLAALYPVSMRDHYPNLDLVNVKLHPEANPHVPSLPQLQRSLELKGRWTPAVKESFQKASDIADRTRVIVYIAGPLTGVSEELKERYGETSDLLASYNTPSNTDSKPDLFFGYVPHLHGTDPVKHPGVTPEEVRDIDHLWARGVAGIHVNFMNPTAHGNAIEIAWGEDAMIPTHTVNQEGNKLSRLTLGMDNVAARTTTKDFATDGLDQLRHFFNEYAAWLKHFPDRDPREFYYMSPTHLRGAIERELGLDPNDWNPIFDPRQFSVYVKDANHPRYGQVGKQIGHDWAESGNIDITFGDGRTETFNDTRPNQLSYWV